ncbi:hypothetical protein Ciccas_001426 [Cichlidogyrus casuarinus]|uniref:C2H2-type domain-containing protein n=1 Tax=Cichlidogyrus casuarinus TaxID=1844966 RepID=A0ABD2QKC2_9PLAT
MTLRKKPFKSLHDDTSVSVMRWYDNRMVQLASTIPGIEPQSEVQRTSVREKKKIQISCPHAIADYNKHMGNVCQRRFARSDERKRHARVHIRQALRTAAANGDAAASAALASGNLNQVSLANNKKPAKRRGKQGAPSTVLIPTGTRIPPPPAQTHSVQLSHTSGGSIPSITGLLATNPTSLPSAQSQHIIFVPTTVPASPTIFMPNSSNFFGRHQQVTVSPSATSLLNGASGGNTFQLQNAQDRKTYLYLPTGTHFNNIP